MDKKLLSINEAAEYLGLAKKTLYNMVWQKKIPHYKPCPKKILFRMEQLDAWLESHFVPAKWDDREN
jgi:excisionase family DNA binding protein